MFKLIFICERSELFMVKNVYLGFSSHGFTYWWIYFFSAHCKHVPCNTLTHSTNEDFLNIKSKGDAKSQTLSRTCTSDITETGNPCAIKVILLACSTDNDIFKSLLTYWQEFFFCYISAQKISTLFDALDEREIAR